MLSDLSRKVEVSTRDMSQLQAKLENTHSTELDERMQRVKTHEEHLKSKFCARETDYIDLSAPVYSVVHCTYFTIIDVLSAKYSTARLYAH